VDEREGDAQAQIPRFARAMKTLAALFGVVWLLEVLLQGTGIGGVRGPLGVFEALALVPASVVQRGHAWQVVTYALLHDPANAMGLVFTVVALWFAGSPIERAWGARRAVALVAAASLAGGVAVVLAGLVSSRIFQGMTLSPAAGNTALLAAWCRMHAKERMSLFGQVTLTGERLLAISVGLTALQLAWQRGGVDVAALAGFAVGWVFAGARPSRDAAAPLRKRESGPRFRVIQGGGGRDLPN
jgi:membrane associated rhomboid family serine protease